MAFPDADIVDGGPALRAARRTKTTEEVDAIRAAVAVADAALAAAVAELRPGVSERELTGVFMEAMASQRRHDAGDAGRRLHHLGRAGSGDGGRARTCRLATSSRSTPASSPMATSARWDGPGRSAPAGAPRSSGTSSDGGIDLWERLLDACRPGAPAVGLLDAYRVAGEPLPVMPIARGLGLGFDDPVIVRDLPRHRVEERLEPGVVLVVTGYVFDDGAGSVITHEPVLITHDGPEVLSCSPYWNPEHAGAQT